MGTTNNGGAREARRRKIIERGSDRLALITGRIQTLPPDSTPSPIHHIPSSPTGDQNGAFGSTSANDDATVNAAHSTTAEAPVRTYTEDSSNAASSEVGDIHPSPLLPSSTVQTLTTRILSDEPVGTQTQRSRLFTPSQISSAVAASKRLRLFGSVLIAIIVVLSYLGHPLIGGNILKSIASFKPLYLVLVTDLTLVLAQLFLKKQRVSERPLSVPSSGGNDWTEQAGKALEAGLAMQKAIDALVMDCSIYTIITVCGISLVSRSGA